jgi:PPK2 family polyphosphate:nucleotide phosphotransferase
VGFRIRAGSQVRLDRIDAGDTSGFSGSKRRAERESAELIRRLDHLQELFYACREHGLLIVLQAFDTGGKDGTIRHVFEGVNPQGVRVAKFGPPTTPEAAHDFLWRVHPEAPARGEIVIFNRSHYEDVLIARVKQLVPAHRWRERYRAINEFERMLVEEGTTVLKFFLLISRREQAERIRERLKDPTKHWKFSAADLDTGENWDAYQAAAEEMFARTSTAFAPWYLIPADKKWYRNWAVSKILVDTLEGFHLAWPALPPELARGSAAKA